MHEGLIKPKQRKVYQYNYVNQICMKTMIRYPILLALLGISAAIASLLSSTGAATYTVGPGESIQEAIDGAQNGDVIEVLSGTYREDLVIDKGLTLRGVDSGGGRPTLEGTKRYASVRLIGDGTTLEGFRLEDCGIDVESDGNLVRNNVLRSSTSGMSIGGSWNNISFNDIKVRWYLFSIGIMIYSNNNTLFRNEVEANGFMASGVYIVDCEDIIIRENKFKGGWFGNGLHVLRSPRNIIIGNQGDNPYWLGRGIFLDASDENLVMGNNATGGARGCSIGIMKSNKNLIVYNNLSNNVYSGIIILSNSSDNLIYLNNLLNNVVHAYSRDPTNLWSSPETVTYVYGGGSFTGYVGNFWEGYAAEDLGCDGIGDEPRLFEGGTDPFPLMDRFDSYHISEDPARGKLVLIRQLPPYFKIDI